MSIRKWLFPMALAGLTTASVALAAPQLTRPAASDATRQEKLTPQDRAVRQEAQDLRKQMRIAGLELALAQEKGAPESELAAKEAQVKDLHAQLRDFRSKHPELWQGRRQAMRGRMMQRGGMGLRQRGGLGPQGGMGMRHRGGMGGGMGMQHRRGMGGGGGQGMGPGRGMRGQMGGRGGEQMRLRQRDRLHAPDQGATVQPAPAPQPEEPTQQPEEPNQDTQPQQ